MARENPGSSIITWLIAGVGAYLLYEWYASSQAVPVSTTPGTTAGMPAQSTVTPPATGPSVIPTPPVGTPTTLVQASLASPLGKTMVSSLQSRVPAGTSSLSGYQWNYYAQQAFGSAYVDPHVNGSSNYSLTAYMQLYLNNLLALNPTSTTLTGLGCVSCGCQGTGCAQCMYGMGRIVTDSDLTYSSMMKRTPGQPIQDIYRHNAKRSETGVM